MKHWKMAIIAVALCGTGLANADMRTVERASEVVMSDFRAPASENGIASFKTCPECSQQVVKVTAGTRYTINGKVVSLPDFRKRLTSVQDREKHIVVVKHHLELDVITAIAVYL